MVYFFLHHRTDPCCQSQNLINDLLIKNTNIHNHHFDDHFRRQFLHVLFLLLEVMAFPFQSVRVFDKNVWNTKMKTYIRRWWRARSEDKRRREKQRCMGERQQIMLWQITQQANKNDYRRSVFTRKTLKLFRLFITHTQTILYTM